MAVCGGGGGRERGLYVVKTVAKQANNTWAQGVGPGPKNTTLCAKTLPAHNTQTYTDDDNSQKNKTRRIGEGEVVRPAATSIHPAHAL